MAFGLDEFEDEVPVLGPPVAGTVLQMASDPRPGVGDDRAESAITMVSDLGLGLDEQGDVTKEQILERFGAVADESGGGRGSKALPARRTGLMVLLGHCRDGRGEAFDKLHVVVAGERADETGGEPPYVPSPFSLVVDLGAPLRSTGCRRVCHECAMEPAP